MPLSRYTVWLILPSDSVCWFLLSCHCNPVYHYKSNCYSAPRCEANSNCWTQSCILASEIWTCSLLFDLSASTSQHLSRQGYLYLAWPLHTVSVDVCILVYAHTYRCPGILAVRTSALWENNRKIVWSLRGLFSVRMRPDIQPWVCYNTSH